MPIDPRLDSFWKNVYRELDAVPMGTQITKMTEALPYQQYKLKLTGLDNVSFVGYFSLPVQGEEPVTKPWPVIISMPGYGPGGQQSVMLSECQRGYAILQIYPRGQGESATLWDLKGKDKLTGNLESPEKHYYRGGYADCFRAIDFVVSRKDMDSSRIALIGTSQAGGISLAVAALDRRIKTVVAHVPFLCNFRMAAKIPKSLVKTLLDRAAANTENSLNTLDYFDVFHLASGLTVPTLLSAGGRDETCPRKTIESVYEKLDGKKSIEFYPHLPHTSCLDFYKLGWDWIGQNL